MLFRSSVRHKGATIGQIIAKNIGPRAKKLFLIFSYLTLLLVIAAFASIVAGTFNGFTAAGEHIPANGSTATISILFIVMAIGFGYCVNRLGMSLLWGSVVGVLGLVVCIRGGTSPADFV